MRVQVIGVDTCHAGEHKNTEGRASLTANAGAIGWMLIGTKVRYMS